MLAWLKNVVSVVVVFALLEVASAQEAPPGIRPPAAPGSAAPGGPGAAAPAGPENKYVKLSHSKDPKTKGLAERYLNLVKYQEWTGASGKSTMAKYVSHEPDLRKVKLAVPKGTGKDRVVKEFEVDVEKLNKTCQYRVKQIDALQKKLDELATTAATEGDPGRPMVDERGVMPQEARGPEAQYSGPGAPQQPSAPPQQAAPEADPSASEPDPLGFAELPPVTPPPGAALPQAAGPGSLPFNVASPGGPPTEGKANRSADGKDWRSNITAFVANITVKPDAAGKPAIDWGEMKELGEMNDLALAQQSPEARARPPEAATPAAISERLGDVHWQLVVDKVEEAPGGIVIPTFHVPELTKPAELRVKLDDAEDVQKWAKLPPGSPVNVTARLTISEPYIVTAKVKMAEPK